MRLERIFFSLLGFSKKKLFTLHYPNMGQIQHNLNPTTDPKIDIQNFELELQIQEFREMQLGGEIQPCSHPQ